MSSSTSSFKREVPVWIAVVLVLVALEIVFRAAGSRVSDNLARTERIPRQAKALAASDDRPRILILGNSLTIRGIDKPALVREARIASEGEPEFEIVALFASELAEWYWIVDQQFASAENMPDVIVLNVDDDFVVDRAAIQARRLALYFSPLSNPFVPTEDVTTFEQQSEFVLAKFSQAYSRAKNLGAVALSRFLPHGEQGSEWTRVRIANRRKQDAGAEAPPASYDRLERLLKLANDSDVKVVCVLMPHRERYDVAAEFHELAQAHDAQVVDARDIASVGPDDFADGRHLNEQGAAKFTPEYARRLMSSLAPVPPPTPSGRDGDETAP
jgi:hypothetical protein